jgi:hypothetical protein
MSTEAIDPASRIEAIIEAVDRWPGVTVHDHRFGGREFRLGTRELGHVHYAGVVDMAFPRAVRDALVEAGRTGTHHVLPDSAWTTFRVRDDRDVDAVLDLLRASYVYHALGVARTPKGHTALDAMDIDAELDALDLPRAARERFDLARERAGR